MMSSKEKENKLFKLRQFFRNPKISGVNKERELWPELERELRPETPVAQRCKALKELGDFVLTSRLEDTSLTKLYDLTKDLIVDNKSTEHRHITLTFYRKLIQGQYENLSLMREHFFLLIQKHEIPEDMGHRLELLKQLTYNGKNITYFEEKIGKFMLEWASDIVEAGLTLTYLEMLVNIIKFNAAHLDNDIVVGIVQHACSLSCNADDTKIGLQCLQVLDAVICYAIFPNETLTDCIVTLCQIVNASLYCHTSYKIMKNLLGSNLGHASLLTMCSILKDRALYENKFLLRGAIFHVTMGLWGSTCGIVSMLRYSQSTVLISFLRALDSQKDIVTYEVILSIRMLIDKCKDLPEHIWDVVCDILFAIADNISFYEKCGMTNELNLQDHFQKTIDKIEELMKNDDVRVNPKTIYDLIEKIAENRPEISVINLIEYRASKITATRPHWLQALHVFVDRFYKISNTKIRIKTIQSLMQIMDNNRAAYEEEILERVVIPQFLNISQENDVLVRKTVAKAVIDFTWHCDSRRCSELLDILEKIMNRPFELYAYDQTILKSENDIQDVLTVVDGLIELFIEKLYRLPSYHAIRIFDILVGHLEQHYQCPQVFESFHGVRMRIFNWMLKARANGSYHLGYPDPKNPNKVRFSFYLGIDASLPYQGVNYQQQFSQSSQETIPPVNFTKISIRRGCKLIVMCLDIERDFYVVELVLKELPNILQNKVLIHGNDMDSLAQTLFKLISERKGTDYMTTFSLNMTTDKFHVLVWPAIASLVIYHNSLNTSNQLAIIEAMKLYILPSRWAAICINTLTIMILEMPETLMRQLAEVLLQMSKMTARADVAIPVLEFLSILSRLPNHLFANFVPRQYMYVFAISVPYTKPQPYDHYIVSLAHHVIAGWFLKCKLPMRRNIIRYIIDSIQSNAHMPFDDIVNEDSSNRKRSSSLTERGSRGREHPNITQQAPNSDLRLLMNESLKTFHMELAETCLDFIARHTFSPCAALSKRLPTAEYLLKDAPSQTWLVGHNLITITTSGCTSLPTRNGLCDRCALQCKNTLQTLQKADTLSTNTGMANSPEIGGGPPQRSEGFDFHNRRYTKASLQYSSGTESGSTDLTSSTSSSSQNQLHSVRQISTDGRFSSSSSSLEALSRRGSNPDSAETKEPSVGSLLGNSLQQQAPQISPNHFSAQPQICACSCTGWAEIYIRRPTGCTSWIMRIQNPISNDCLGNQLPLHDLINMFLPSQHGGVLGPDFLSDIQLSSPPSVIQSSTIPESKEVNLETVESRKDEQDVAKSLAKVRALKRQEEITSTSASGPIDIPKQTTRKKESAGSFSDVDAEEEDVPFEDGDSRSRNPVRRVNSSPEMSSNWRNPFMATKQGGRNNDMPISGGTVIVAAGGSGTVTTTTNEKDDIICIEADQQQKKKGFGKDIRVSCEAIPEEIPGSTPPSLTEFLKDPSKPAEKDLNSGNSNLSKDQAMIFPQKQHSADDVPMQTANVSASASTTSLKIPIDSQKITTKPPQSPAPLSPRLLARNAANKIAAAKSRSGPDNNVNGDMLRGRSKTISVVEEMSRTQRPLASFRQRGSNTTSTSRLNISPSFVFLQLFYTGQLQTTETPLKVGQDTLKKISLLDLIPPFETHKIGVLYVGPGQCNNETEILRNRCGSVRYMEFLRDLGILVSLKDARENNLFVNMETDGRDGNFTYVWKDDIVQVTFHVATLMPNKEQDPKCNEKKKHIGNDFVTIVYNESGEEYNLNTIKGQFNYACVIVQPLELKSNRIFVRAKDEIAKYVCHSEPKIISDGNAALLARQMALHANLASLVSRSLDTNTPYASNWLERLRRIKQIRAKLIEEQQTTKSNEQSFNSSGSSNDVSKGHRPNIYDFTKYT